MAIAQISASIEIEGDKSTRVVLPVVPSSFNEESTWNATTVNINSFGEVSLLGKKNLKKLPFTSFFPYRWGPYCSVGSNELKEPYKYVSLIKNMQGKICRLVMSNTDSAYDMLCTINSFTYGESDGTGDVQYTLDIVEYRIPTIKTVKASTPTSKKASKTTPKRVSKPVSKTYKTKTNDTLYKIAKKKHGTKKAKSYAKKIYNLNKKTLNSAYARYTKIILKRKNGKAAAKKYKKTAVINKQIPKNVTLKLPK